MIYLVYKKHMLLGEVEKDMEDLDISRSVSSDVLVAHLMCRMSVCSTAQRVWQEGSSSSELSLSCFSLTPGSGSGRLCPAGIRNQIRHGYT